MNIEVGGELHYVPDVLFEDGTYKDAEDYIKTTLAYRKMVTQHSPLNTKEEETEKPLTVEELVQKLNYLYSNGDESFVAPFEVYYNDDTDSLDIILEIQEQIYSEKIDTKSIEDVLHKAKKCLEKYLGRINAIKKTK